jgi:hypothetical protein
MNIVELEKKYHGFYTPAFKILIGKKDLLTTEHLEISSVQVDNTLRNSDQFSFIVNSSFNFQSREFHKIEGLFDFGAVVEIKMGYLDESKMDVLIKGIITSVKTNFPANGLPQLTVSGYDRSHRMTKSKVSRNWDNKKDSEIAATIAKEHKLSAIIQDTKICQPKVEQYQESDFQLLKKLAERNCFEFYIQQDSLVFRESESKKDAIVTLEWGKGLVSFSPEMNIAEQIAEVEVGGWNVNTKKPIVGKAKTGDEPGRDRQRKSGGEHSAIAFKEKPVLKVRLPVYSQEEADRRACGILKRRSEKFLTGSGESIGIPEIRADRNIKLEGLGTLFSKIYYIDQSTHTINNSGYKTTFKVKETTV